jgi:predicted RNase H-like nuclease (RuvC/YqgF family)
MSVNSEYQPSFMSKAEKNLNSMHGNKAKELETLRLDVNMKDDEIQQLKKKFSAANARKDTLEVQIKEIKQTFQSKIQILIDKTENDDKLIIMLKQEIARLEQNKGVKGTLSTGHKI